MRLSKLSVLLLAIVVFLTPVAFFRPTIGLLAYYWLSYMRPFHFLWDPIGASYGMAIAIALLIGYVFFSMRDQPPKITPLTPLILLGIWIFLSSEFAYMPTLAYEKAWEFARVVIMCIMTITLINTDIKLKQIMLTIGVSAGLLGVHGLSQFLRGAPVVKGPGGQAGAEQDFAIFLTTTLPIVFYLARGEPNRRLRMMFYFMAVSMAISVIFTYNRGGFLGLCAVIIGIAVKLRRKTLGILGLLFLYLLFILFAPQSVKERVHTISGYQQDPSTLARFQMWAAAIEMVKTHPFLGIGPKNFIDVFRLFGPPDVVGRDTHNGYLRLAAESGLPALFLYLFIIFYYHRKIRKTRKLLEKYGGSESMINYCHSMEVMFLGYVVPNFFISRHDFDIFYYTVALICCIASQAQEQLKGKISEAERRRRVRPLPVRQRADLPVS